jgi:hypothetical protein
MSFDDDLQTGSSAVPTEQDIHGPPPRDEGNYPAAAAGGLVFLLLSV